jgi:ABC-type multidrug transport system fused ATPase/permease subunit
MPINSLWHVYVRVIGLLAPEKTLAMLLVSANLALAAILLLEPWLFGRVIDALVAPERSNAWTYIWLWAAFGMLGIGAGVWVSLQSDRMAHRRRLAIITKFFEHAIAMPLAFHGEHHTSRLLRIMHTGSASLFTIWLGFLREHLTTLLSILIMLPLALKLNWQLALLMTGLMISFALFNALAMRRTGKAQNQVEELHHEIAERAGDVLSNALVVQSFNRGDAEVADIRALTERVLQAQYPVLRGWAWLSVANRAASTLTIVAIFLLGASLHSKGQVTVAGVHAAAVSTLIPALQRRVAWLGGVTDGEDSFPQTDGKHLPASRIFFAALTSRSCLSPQALHIHTLTTSLSRPVGPVRA